jgi:hypothetical protein
MSDPLADIKARLKSGLSPSVSSKPSYAVGTVSQTPHKPAPIDPKSPISASELDALYGKGSQVPGTHPHTSGLKAVYEAGAAGKRA